MQIRFLTMTMPVQQWQANSAEPQAEVIGDAVGEAVAESVTDAVEAAEERAEVAEATAGAITDAVVAMEQQRRIDAALTEMDTWRGQLGSEFQSLREQMTGMAEQLSALTLATVLTSQSEPEPVIVEASPIPPPPPTPPTSEANPSDPAIAEDAPREAEPNERDRKAGRRNRRI